LIRAFNAAAITDNLQRRCLIRVILLIGINSSLFIANLQAIPVATQAGNKRIEWTVGSLYRGWLAGYACSTLGQLPNKSSLLIYYVTFYFLLTYFISVAALPTLLHPVFSFH
jgi:hypothetical protein